MNKYVISLIITLILGGAVAVGLNVFHFSSAESSNKDYDQSSELTSLKEDLSNACANLKILSTRLDKLESSQKDLAVSLQGLQGEQSTPTKITIPKNLSIDSKQLSTNDLHDFVFACIDEDQKLKEEERVKRREELQKQMLEKRKQYEEFKKGPYDKFNVKVNSMASLINLDEAQKNNYFELLKKYSDKYQEARKNLPGLKKGQNGARDIRSLGRDERREYFKQFQDLSKNLQQEFSEEMKDILTDTQFEAYLKQPGRIQSFQNSGMSSGPGGNIRSKFFGRNSRRGGSGGRGR